MVDSDYRSSNSHLPQTWHSPIAYANPQSHMKIPQLFTDSKGCGNTSNTRSNGEYVVNPKQFAPLKNTWRQLPTGYQDYSTPQTPPVSDVPLIYCW